MEFWSRTDEEEELRRMKNKPVQGVKKRCCLLAGGAADFYATLVTVSLLVDDLASHMCVWIGGLCMLSVFEKWHIYFRILVYEQVKLGFS